MRLPITPNTLKYLPLSSSTLSCAPLNRATATARRASSTPSSPSSCARTARKTRRCAQRALRSRRARFQSDDLLFAFFPLYRLKYIEAELAKRRGAAGGGEAEAAPVEGWAAAEAALYETPAELRQDSPGRGAADQEGADRWLTGITEVQLPVEYKLKVRCLLLLSQTREPIELALAALINR